MAICEELLEILVCPVCKAPVSLRPDENALQCERCRRLYPIRQDIPVMLVEESWLEEEG